MAFFPTRSFFRLPFQRGFPFSSGSNSARNTSFTTWVRLNTLTGTDGETNVVLTLRMLLNRLVRVLINSSGSLLRGSATPVPPALA